MLEAAGTRMSQTQTIGDFLEWSRCPVCDGGERAEYVGFSALTFSRCASCSAVYKSKEARGLLPAGFYEQGYFKAASRGVTSASSAGCARRWAKLPTV
ncbi:MAG: hypothetical protein K1X64_06105 [Myxococcaceae bacterium]|nr:hypothetical protein [Myxococcaceae bacterium]